MKGTTPTWWPPWSHRGWLLLALALTVGVVAGTVLLLGDRVDGPAGAGAPTGPRALPSASRYLSCSGNDDTAVLTQALAGLTPGDQLVIPAGVVCRHSTVLVINTADVWISGPGTLLATNEATSGIRLDADGIVLDGGLTVAATGVSRRWGTGDQMGVLLAPGRTGIVLQDITVTGSAAAGIFVAGASDFLLDRVTVTGTMADGIHLTNGSHNGTIRDASVTGAGDDGVAVVSYRDNQEVCHDLEIVNPTVTADRGGRGIAVVGGRHISFRNIRVESASAASVYIAQSSRDPAEPASWDTSSVQDVQILGGTLVDSNSSSAVSNGAVVVGSAGPAGYGVSQVRMTDLTVRGTRSSAPTEVGIYSYGGGSIDGVSMQDFTISDGPDRTFATNVPAGYLLTGWTVNGAAMATRGR